MVSNQMPNQILPVRCRFAPSPTGYLHVGGARTALFNYLFAKRNSGTFILRIEDTDRERSTQDATDAILQGLEWLELPCDEGPYFQSERNALYREYAVHLLNSGNAYPCTCSPEELEAKRNEQRNKHQKPQYDRRHRPQDCVAQSTALPTGNEGIPFVIRLRAPLEGQLVFHDLIIGEVVTPSEEIDDFILLRSDGTPTYNFTVVVDDIDMRISHVIRGMDHVSNTPKQILIYQALRAELPRFAHMPMILGPDKKKLSKRHGATSVVEYKHQGFLPDAFVNYLARLGWSHGDQEIFTRSELCSLFSLENVGKSAAVFDWNKLLWVSAQHIKMASTEKLALGVIDFLTFQGFPGSKLNTDPAFLKLLESLRERSQTLKDMAESCLWYIQEEPAFVLQPDAAEKYLRKDMGQVLGVLILQLEQLSSFVEKEIEIMFHQVMTTFGIKLGDLAQAVRVALTGSSVSPPIYTVLEVLGKERSLIRLRKAMAYVESTYDHNKRLD